MGHKDIQFTIRLNAEINDKATAKAKDMNITRAEIIRLALDSYLTQTGSNPNPTTETLLIEHQQKELAEKNEQINELLRQQNQNQQIISGIQTDLVSTIVWIE